jgi:RNA polymerase sigma-70 factor (ECF subfamily)
MSPGEGARRAVAFGLYEVMSEPSPAAPTFDAVYRECFQHVWHTLRRLGVPDRDLEDSVHDVFVVVHRRLVDFDAARSVRPWVTGIAYRVASDDRRRARRQREVFDDSIDAVDGRRGADETIDADRARERVHRTLALLPLDQRIVFVMHDIDGFAIPDIQRELAVPLNTLYSRLRLARAKFESAIRAEEARRGP